MPRKSARGRGVQQRRLDAQRQVAVSGAGLAEARHGGACVPDAGMAAGLPLAVLPADGALGLQRPAQRVPLAADGLDVVALRLPSLAVAGFAVAQLPGPRKHEVDEDGAAEPVVRLLVPLGAHHPVEVLRDVRLELQREAHHLR